MQTRPEDKNETRTTEGGLDRVRRRRVFTWVRRATLAGLVLTVAVHLVLAVVAGFWSVPRGSPGEGVESGELIDFAVLTEADLAAAGDSALDAEAVDVPDASDSALTELSLFDAAQSAAIDELATERVEVAIDTGAGDLTGDGADLGESAGAGSLGGASFFGLSAAGTRFAYIVDISSSMRDDGKMATTQGELTRSIGALAENGEYLIVLYSNDAVPLGGRRAYRDATESNKRSTRVQIAEIFPSGGTHPLPAFQMLYAMRTKPDAIYFMTDGRFDADVPARVAEMNSRFRIPIHTILFGEPAANAVIRNQVREQMQQIARQSGGNFAHHAVARGGRP